tara:strand:+ start:841 stop:1542 length:702 start_codon:yes stop_codon:yes gene_type:complete
MGIVAIPSINVGDEITSTTINTFIASVNALPTTINEDNVRDQGIDRRNIAANCATYTDQTADFWYKSNASHVISTATGGVFGLTTPNITIGAGSSLTLAPDEKMIIYCSFEYHVVLDLTASIRLNRDDASLPGAYEVQFSLGWKYNGTPSYSAIVGSLRKSNIILASYEPTIPGYWFTPKASLTIVTVIENTTGLSKNYNITLLGQAIRSNDFAKTVIANVESVQLFAKIVRK